MTSPLVEACAQWIDALETVRSEMNDWADAYNEEFLSLSDGDAGTDLVFQSADAFLDIDSISWELGTTIDKIEQFRDRS